VEITVGEEFIKLKIEQLAVHLQVLKNGEIRAESNIDGFDATAFTSELTKSKSIPLSLHTLFANK
jgi:hypothetical protein